MIRLLLFIWLCIASAPAHAATVYTYNFSVGPYLDSNNLPPPIVTTWNGSFALEMDLTSFLGETGFVNSFTPNTNDVGFAFNASNTIFGKTTQALVPDPVFRIYVGGLGLSSTPSIAQAGGGVGASNDFRIGFDINQTGSVLQVLLGSNIGADYSNASPPSAYVAQSATVSLAAVSPAVIALPATLGMGLVGLGALGLLAVGRRRA